MNHHHGIHLAKLLALSLVTGVASAQTSLTVAANYDFSGGTPPGGTLEGDATISGGVLHLDGNGDHLSFFTTPLAATDDYVIEAIFNANAFGGFNFIVYNGNTNNSGGQAILQEGGTLDGLLPGVAIQGTSAAAPTGSAVALALVRDGGVSTIYVDGVAQTTVASGGTPSSAASVLHIGAGIAGSGAAEGFFDGTIDRVRLSAISGTFDPADLLGPGDGTAPVGQILLSGATVDDLSVTETAADASVELSGATADVTLFWATTDHRTDLADWQTNGSSSALGNQAVGTVNGSLSGLAADTVYTVRFHAVNTVPEPDEEAWSAPVTFGTPFVPGQMVTDLAATAVAHDQIDLTWTDSFHTEEEYFLEASDDGGANFFFLATLPANATSYSDRSVSALTSYQYRILAFSIPSGDSDWSNVAGATTPAEPPFTPTVRSDFDFEDNMIPAAFGTTAFGSGPATGGGVLTFDGTTAIQADTTTIYGGTAPADDFVYEVILTPSALDAFNIAAAMVDAGGANRGSFLFQQSGVYRLIESGEGVAAATTAPVIGTPVALAFVMDAGTARLFVNGSEEASRTFTPDGPTPIDTATLEAVVLGGNLFDGLQGNGAFDGSIDRFRASTFIGPFDPGFLLTASAADTFASWIAGFSVGGMTGFNDDFDFDGLGNGLENFLGTDPGAWNAGLTQVSSDGTGATFQHPQIGTPARDVTGAYEWSADLENWNDSGDEAGGTTVLITPRVDDPVAGTTTVTATAGGTIPARLFVRAKAMQTL